jgi:hypothetical protein
MDEAPIVGAKADLESLDGVATTPALARPEQPQKAQGVSDDA